MLNKDNIDLKIILSLINAYEELYEKEKISEKQLNSIFSLLDNCHKYSTEEMKTELHKIFPENKPGN